MQELKTAVITCPRKGASYLPSTLKDMAEQDPGAAGRPCGVFSDSLVLPEGLPPWLNHVECSDQDRLDRIRTEELFGTLNLQRALRWAANNSEFVCVLEDDVKFAGDWQSRGLAICRRLVERKQPWLLTLQHFYPHEGHFDAVEGCDGQIMKWNEQGPLWGSQGYMMLASTARGFADLFELKFTLPAPERRWWMMDEGIWRMCAVEHRYGIYAPNPCLIQHVGDVSSLYEWETVRPGRMCLHFDQASRK